MTGSDTTRFNLAAPEGYVLPQYWIAMHRIFHIKIDAKFPAAGDLRAISLDHHDIVAIPGEMRESLLGKSGRILRLFHQIDDPLGSFPGVHTKKGNTWLAGFGNMPGGKPVKAANFNNDAARRHAPGQFHEPMELCFGHLPWDGKVQNRSRSLDRVAP